MARRKNLKSLTCRFCGDTYDGTTPDALSHWTHNHPAECPYRQDAMPAINGVHVGDLWHNDGTGNTYRVEALHLGGCGTYTDREAVAVLAVEGEKPSDYRYVMPHPLWSLAEHFDPVTRPGDYPVPIETRTDERFPHHQPTRWACDPWRCPAYRRIGSHDLERTAKWPENEEQERWASYCTCGFQIGWHATEAEAVAAHAAHVEEEAHRDQDAAYWHAWHSLYQHAVTGWGRWWQIDAASPEAVALREPQPGEQLALI